jgi:hypothetical protein
MARLVVSTMVIAIPFIRCCGWHDTCRDGGPVARDSLVSRPEHGHPPDRWVPFPDKADQS